MVCNGNGLMAPLVSSFDDCFCIGHSVHIAHLGMTVELYSFLRAVICPAVLKTGDFLDPHYRTNGQFTVVPVNSSDSLQFNKSLGLDPFQDFSHLVISGKHFHSNRVAEIRNGKDDNGLFVPDFSGLQCHDLSPDTDFSHLRLDIFQGNSLVFKVPSVEHIGIVGTLYAPLKVRETPVSSGSSFIAFKGFPRFSFLFLLSVFLCLLCSISGTFFFLSSFILCPCSLLFLPDILSFSLHGVFFLMLSERGHLYNMSRLLLKLELTVFPNLAFFGFLVLCLHLQRKGAALAKDLFYVLDKLILFAFCQHIGFKDHVHGICLGKRNNSIPEHIKYQNAVMFQFQRHGRAVRIQKDFRRILTGEVKPLQDFHFHRHPWKTLGCNGLFQGVNIFLMNPLPAADINPDMIPFLVNGNFRYHYFLQESPQLSHKLQIPEHLQKCFLHEAMPPLFTSNSPVPDGAPAKADPQVPF